MQSVPTGGVAVAPRRHPTGDIGIITFAIFRFGLLVTAVMILVDNIPTAVPIVPHGPSWAALPGNLSIALVVALACFGFYAARAGQPLFGKLQLKLKSEARQVCQTLQTLTSLADSFRPGGRRRLPRILGPRMLRVASAQFLSHLRIRAIPEAAQVARQLHRAGRSAPAAPAAPARAAGRCAASRPDRTTPEASPTPTRCHPSSYSSRTWRPLGTAASPARRDRGRAGSRRRQRARQMRHRRAVAPRMPRRGPALVEVDRRGRQSAARRSSRSSSSRGPRVEPCVGQERAGDVRIDGGRMLGEHQRVVAIDAARFDATGFRVEPMHDVGRGRLQPLAIDAAGDANRIGTDVARPFAATRCAASATPADVERDEELAVANAALRRHDVAPAPDREQHIRRPRLAALRDAIRVAGQHRSAESASSSWRIADCGLRIDESVATVESAIRNPKSAMIRPRAAHAAAPCRQLSSADRRSDVVDAVRGGSRWRSDSSAHACAIVARAACGDQHPRQPRMQRQAADLFAELA